MIVNLVFHFRNMETIYTREELNEIMYEYTRNSAKDLQNKSLILIKNYLIKRLFMYNIYYRVKSIKSLKDFIDPYKNSFIKLIKDSWLEVEKEFIVII